jgi:putative mycofactocin binding protein MftB
LIYRLSPGARARKESFGLLFYDSGDAKLTFVRSGGLLELDRDDAGHGLLKVSDGKCSEAAKVDRILATLLKKGLIVDERKDV